MSLRRIYDHCRDAGIETFRPKPQYVRGGLIFTCPICGKEISSHSYLNLRAWEDHCRDHLEDCEKRSGEDRLTCDDCANRGTLMCELDGVLLFGDSAECCPMFDPIEGGEHEAE